MPVLKEDDWKTISYEFWEILNIPNCIGALDGKHTVIEASRKSGSLYLNHKKTFSIVLMVLVDAKYKCIVVDIGFYGKSSDGGVFSCSKMGEAFEKNQFNVPNGTL